MARKTSTKGALLASYNRLLEAEEKRKELAPARLVTMKADPEWIEAVYQKNQALEAFLAEARRACDAWRSDDARPA